MSVTLLWLAAALFLLLIEAFTVTLYGVVIALGCFSAAGLAFYMGDVWHWYQLVLCLVVVAIGSYYIPRIFHRTGVSLQTGLDEYIGTQTTIKIIDGTTKVTLGGVDRLVHSEKTLSEGESVTIISRNGTILTVE